MWKFIFPLFALALLIGCEPQTPDTPMSQNPSSESTNPVGFDGEILEGTHTVILHTSMGDITLELDADAAPKTVTNFIALAQTGYYNDLTFHRVMNDFMIQGGDPEGNGTGGESVFGETFEDEINADSYGLDDQKLKDVTDEALPPELENATVKEYLALTGYQFNDNLDSLPMERGYIAMANRGPNTNGSQFFIIQRKDGTDWLNAKHTVFGKVTEGMDVVDAIAATPVDPQSTPLDPVTFTVEVVQ